MTRPSILVEVMIVLKNEERVTCGVIADIDASMSL